MENKTINYTPKCPYNLNLYRKRFISRFVSWSYRLVGIYDGIKDRKICGVSLVKEVDSPYAKTMSATGSQSTRYFILDEVFKNAEFSENDSFLDVGCGKGRVLAYLYSKGAKCKLNGIELNKEVADFAKKWAEQYPEINITEGDIFKNDLGKYNIFFLNRPFLKDKFAEFILKLESEATRDIRLFYWADTESGNLLNGRDGWTLGRRDWLFKSHGFYLTSFPQRYSVWTFKPNK